MPVMAGTDSQPLTELASVTAQLRGVTRVVDGLWERSLLDGLGGPAMELGEASRALHQALLAIAEAGVPALGPG